MKSNRVLKEIFFTADYDFIFIDLIERLKI